MIKLKWLGLIPWILLFIFGVWLFNIATGAGALGQLYIIPAFFIALVLSLILFLIGNYYDKIKIANLQKTEKPKKWLIVGLSLGFTLFLISRFFQFTILSYFQFVSSPICLLSGRMFGCSWISHLLTNLIFFSIVSFIFSWILEKLKSRKPQAN